MRRPGVSVLLFLAYFFPSYWGATSLVRGLPPLFDVALHGHEIVVMNVRFSGVEVVAAPPHGTPLPRGGRRSETAGTVVAFAAAVAVLLAFRGRSLAHLFVACLGQAALQGPVASLIFFPDRASGARIAAATVSFLILVVGLRGIAADVHCDTRLRRVTGVLGAYALPALGCTMIGMRGWRPGWAAALLLPAVLAAFLVCVMPFRGIPREGLGAGALAAGLVLTAAVGTGIQAMQMGTENARSAARASALRGVSLGEVPSASHVVFQKGVNLTAEWPDGYDSPRIATMLDELKKHAVDSVALVPYAFSPRERPEVRFGGANAWERDDAVEYVAALAHQRGLRVLLKPQVWVGRGYPGDLDYPNPTDRAAWFESYRAFAAHYAQLATRIHAELFCVGVEFSKLARYDAEWRRVIAVARAGYRGPVVYAANFGPEFESITFWDAVDYIGLNNYYPLPDDLDAAAVVAKVEAVQRRFGKPVIFPEAGYSSVSGGNREPWAEMPGTPSMESQARCYEALMRAFYRKPWFQGVYWWKVGTNGFGGTEDASHTPWRKPAMDVVGRWYRGGGR